MANKPALNAIRKSFDKKLQGAADLFSAVHLTRLPTSFLRPEVQSWQPLHDMVLVVRRRRSCAAFLPGRSSLFHTYSFASRPHHRCHTNPKPYRTLINQSSQRLQRGCTASPWTRARQKAFTGLRRRTASARQEHQVLCELPQTGNLLRALCPPLL